MIAELTMRILDYESGELEPEEIQALFRDLANSGLVDHLQGSYGRMFQDLVWMNILQQNDKGIWEIKE